MTERQVQLIVDFEPRVIMVTPSYFLSILDEMERAGRRPARHRRWRSASSAPSRGPTRCGARSRSAAGHARRRHLRAVRGDGARASRRSACETKDGLHIWEDHFYPEVVDPVTDEPVADGEEGELVFTSLTKQAMPVVRYRTRDLTRLLPGTARPGVPADGEGHRPHRRHDDRARRQRLPDPGRGADPRRAGARRRTTCAC